MFATGTDSLTVRQTIVGLTVPLNKPVNRVKIFTKYFASNRLRLTTSLTMAAHTAGPLSVAMENHTDELEIEWL